MIRKIIHIDEEKCNGCGLCATACHEGAIDIIDGKAKLVRENFCDGFGDCLPGCPTGAITFEEREAPAYDEAAVQENKKKKELQEKMKHLHQEFMRGKVTLIGCPKLDAVDYSEKLTEILRSNDIQSVTILRMEVPCCGGLEMAAKKALQTSGKFIPWQVVTISIDGKILD